MSDLNNATKEQLEGFRAWLMDKIARERAAMIKEVDTGTMGRHETYVRVLDELDRLRDD